MGVDFLTLYTPVCAVFDASVGARLTCGGVVAARSQFRITIPPVSNQ